MTENIKASSYTIEQVRTETINATILIAAIAGGFAYLLSLTRFFDTGFNISFVIEFLVMFSVTIIAFKRHTLQNSFKAAVIIFLIFLFSISDAVVYGLFSAARVYLLLIPFFAVLFYSIRTSLILFLAAIFIFLSVGYLHFQGMLVMPETYEPTLYVLRMYPWIINAIHIITVAVVITLVTRKFLNAFQLLIDELQLSNKLISEREQNYREIFNSSSDAIFVHDIADGRVVDVNDAMLRMYGYQRQEIIGRGIVEYSSNEDPYIVETAMNNFKAAVKGSETKFDWQALKKSGDLFWVEVVLRKASIGGKEMVLAMVRDISEKKKTELELDKYRNKLEKLVQERTEELEAANEELTAMNEELQTQHEVLEDAMNNLQKTQQQLVFSEKKASLGVLASGVAHEINNPLNFIAGGVMALENYVHDNLAKHASQLDPLLKGINEGIKRAHKIVVSLNQYTRSGENTHPMPCNIHEILDRCLHILEDQYDNRISIGKKYTRLGRDLIARESQIYQAFFNIIENAIQAITEKGNITLTTCEDISGLIIEIRDTGSGIKKEDLLRVTDPFFTTKPPGQGTGLGLPIAANIIREHKGEVRIESEPGQGTCVTVSLPFFAD